jgi:hypothetical protein
MVFIKTPQNSSISFAACSILANTQFAGPFRFSKDCTVKVRSEGGNLNQVYYQHKDAMLCRFPDMVRY